MRSSTPTPTACRRRRRCCRAMLERTRIGLKVDVDTLRGTREGVPRLMALLRKLGLDATFYFSVGPDNTGRAMRRVFRKGFAQKVARTSVLKHYGLKTLLYGVLLPGPDIGRSAGGVMRSVHDAGFEVGLHTYDHVRWQDYVAKATAAWTRVEFELGLEAFERVFGFLPQSHAAAGWQINAHGLALEQEYGLRYATDTPGGPPFFPVLAQRTRPLPQLPPTWPTSDEDLGVDRVDASTIADAVFRSSAAAADAQPSDDLQVFTLHAELEGMRLLDAFESLLVKWRGAGAPRRRLATNHELAMQRPFPARAGVSGAGAGGAGRLARARARALPPPANARSR